ALNTLDDLTRIECRPARFLGMGEVENLRKEIVDAVDLLGDIVEQLLFLWAKLGARAHEVTRRLDDAERVAHLVRDRHRRFAKRRKTFLASHFRFTRPGLL